MATMYITEYYSTDSGSPTEPGVDQTFSFSGTAGNSTPFSATTILIRINADAIASIKIGKNAVATTANKRVSLGVTEYFAVQSGDRLSAIINT